LGRGWVDDLDGATFFVVIREIEAQRLDYRVFADEDSARGFYHLAVDVCWNEPDDAAYGDPSLVTNCWLYAVNRQDGAVSAGGVLLATCFP
jgi:hypothetical protein